MSGESGGYLRLFVPHSYAEKKPDDLSWWDDVGFILNKRRVIVWWQHPRQVYADAIDERAWDEAGPAPTSDWPRKGAIKNYRRVGASRKKVVSYTTAAPTDERRAYYAHLRSIVKRLSDEGIELEVRASWRRETLDWATGISLVVPMEVRSEVELAEVAKLARGLMLGNTTLDREFPAYVYGKGDWLREQSRS